MDGNDGIIWGEEDCLRRVRLLEACGMAQAAEAPLSLTELAEELHITSSTIRMELDGLSTLGLILDGLEERLPPILRHAGRQFLAGGPEIRREAQMRMSTAAAKVRGSLIESCPAIAARDTYKDRPGSRPTAIRTEMRNRCGIDPRRNAE